MHSLTPSAGSLHAPKPCSNCKSIPKADGRPSGTYVCGPWWWRKAQPHHIYRKGGDSVCAEKGIIDQATALGATLMLVWVDGSPLVGDLLLLNLKGREIHYGGFGHQVGIRLRDLHRGSHGTQMALALETAA
jgi:hypothetical protein